MTRQTLLRIMLVVPCLVVAARADDTTSSANAARFEAIKKLAGDWVEVGEDGKPTDKVVSSFRVTAAGTAVQETLFPGTEREMITMYHLDGPDLLLTHYCMLGNQPRLRAEAGADANRIAFKFVGATNLKSENDSHMHEATFMIAGPDRFQAEWAGRKDGEECHKVAFDLVRKPK